MIEKCLQDLRAEQALERIILETSQYSAPFFEKFGFVTTGIQENGFGIGLDLYSMVLELDETATK